MPEGSDEDDPRGSAGTGGDGSTPGEYEARKTQRSLEARAVYVEVNDGGEATIRTGTQLGSLLNQHYGKAEVIFNRLIILMVLVVLSLLLWRIKLLEGIVAAVVRFATSI